ncbi:hypothetical protein VCRA2120E57_100069 [Vibrio crassostreae]|nr:hypothetical protein VCRA2120E57_100069 [Vibrio crassostreae]
MLKMLIVYFTLKNISFEMDFINLIISQFNYSIYHQSKKLFNLHPTPN